MSRQDMLDRALAALYDAALDEALWPAASALIDEACGLTGNGLVVCDRFGENVGIVHAALFYQGQHREDLQREYLEVYHLLDERAPRLRQLPDGQLVHVSDLFTREELKTSPVYNEALRRMGAQNGLNVRLDGPRGSHIFWVTADPVGSGGWEPDQIDVIKRLLPHIRHFVWVSHTLRAAELLGASLTELLDNTRIGIIHLDRNGRVVEANDRALGLLGPDGGLSEKEGFLSAWLPADDANLQRLLAAALPALGADSPTGDVMVVQRPFLPSLVVHVNPVAAYRKGLGLGRLAAMVMLVDPVSQPRISPGLVARVLGLTPAESRVAAMLAEGRRVGEIALVTGRQKSTVYWLLQQVYGKLGISRQVDLVKLVLSLSDLWNHEAEH